LQWLLGTSKEDGSYTIIELNINVIVSSVNTSLNDKSNANALKLNKAYANMVIVAVAKAMGMNSFFHE